jgi:hypothetical protein
VIRRLSILAAAAALAASAAPAVAATSNAGTGPPSNKLITLEHEGVETSTAVVVLIGANNYG